MELLNVSHLCKTYGTGESRVNALKDSGRVYSAAGGTGHYGYHRKISKRDIGRPAGP